MLLPPGSLSEPLGGSFKAVEPQHPRQSDMHEVHHHLVDLDGIYLGVVKRWCAWGYPATEPVREQYWTSSCVCSNYSSC